MVYSSVDWTKLETKQRVACWLSSVRVQMNTTDLVGVTCANIYSSQTGTN